MSKSTGSSAKRQPIEAKRVKRRLTPAGTTIEARENQIIRLAYDLVEERIRKKTATSQEVTQFIKMGSSQAQLEREKLKQENALLAAKTESLASQKRVEELYRNAMTAFKTYSGQEETHNDDSKD